jgi:Ankyrin repeats (3 copies)
MCADRPRRDRGGFSISMGAMPPAHISNVKFAIEAGDADSLRGLLAANPELANELIRWGKKGNILTHPLHYVSDVVFDGTLGRERAVPLIEALLEAGADPNHQAANGETPLIGAASLGAEDIGLRLLDARARVESRGIFEATALHWASMLGLKRLVGRLIEMGAELNRADTQYGSPPVGWAIHGYFDSAPAKHPANHVEVVRLLVVAGAEVRPEWVADEKVRADAAMLAALSLK